MVPSRTQIEELDGAQRHHLRKHSSMLTSGRPHNSFFLVDLYLFSFFSPLVVVCGMFCASWFGRWNLLGGRLEVQSRKRSQKKRRERKERTRNKTNNYNRHQHSHSTHKRGRRGTLFNHIPHAYTHTIALLSGEFDISSGLGRCADAAPVRIHPTVIITLCAR